MRRFLMTLVVGVVVGACGGVMTGEESVAEGTPLGQAEQPYRCGFCGDGYCCPDFETSDGCPADCGLPECGDGVCNSNESSTTCPADCGPVSSCGDGVCNGGETGATCPADCAQLLCGNNICNSNNGETSTSCPSDCGSIPNCGNGFCNAGETSLNCPDDCPCTTGRCP